MRDTRPERSASPWSAPPSSGIDRVLVTCDDDNVGSARTIESQGGVLEDIRRGKRRYWIQR